MEEQSKILKKQPQCVTSQSYREKSFGRKFVMSFFFFYYFSFTTSDFEFYLYVNFQILIRKKLSISIKKREFIQILTLDLLLKDRSFKFNKNSLYLCNSLVTCIVKEKKNSIINFLISFP